MPYKRSFVVVEIQLGSVCTGQNWRNSTPLYGGIELERCDWLINVKGPF